MNKILFINKSSRLPSIIIMSVSLLWIFAVMLNAQDQELWNNKRCAVSLTYDDALNVHLDIVQPALDSLGFKGTFYIPISFPGFRERLQDWKKLAANGNELGNHTLFHPCAGSYPGRDWVQPDYDLDGYTMKRFIDEVEVANTTLRAIDGRRTRTFAYTCGDTMIGDSSFVPKIKKYFAGARSVTPMMQK
ncbi:MAG: polysaccharide deacetylase family protein, partial [Calditrichaceae bacterium]